VHDIDSIIVRDKTKVVLGFGSIWGLFALGAMLIGSFTLGTNDSPPEVIAIVLYGLTILPSCILAIWFRKQMAIWLATLSVIAIFGFVYQVAGLFVDGRTIAEKSISLIVPLMIASIPGLIGVYLLRVSD